MIAWCNAQGGINGRKIVGDYYDAAVTNVDTRDDRRPARPTSCWSARASPSTASAEQTRLGCNLAAVPGFTVVPGRGQRLRDVPGVAEPGERQPGVVGLPGREALRQQDQARRRVRLHPLDPGGVDGQGRAGLHRGRLEVPQLPVPDQLQRRGQLHAVRPEAPELRRPDHLQRLHPGADPLRRAPGREPARLQPHLGRGLRRLHAELRAVEHGRPGQQHLRPYQPTSRWRRPRSSRPSPSTSTSSRRTAASPPSSASRRPPRSSCGPPRPRRAARP